MIWLGDQYLDLIYDSETGRVEDCSGLQTEQLPGAYPTPACSPPSYRNPGDGVRNQSLWTRQVQALTDGAVFYESESSPPMYPSPAFSLSGEECLENPIIGGGNAWIQIPEWSANALPSPPYTLTWE